MASLNKVMLIGNVGREPEMRYTSSQKAVTSFSIAVTAKGRDGAEDETEWFNVTAWEKLAEVANDLVTKGRQVYVEGRLKIRHYDDKNGEKKTSVDVVASTLLVLGARPEGSRPTSRAGTQESLDLDSIPF